MAIKINQTDVINDQGYAVNIANCTVAGSAVVYGPKTSPIITVSCAAGTGTINCSTSNYFELITLIQVKTTLTFINIPIGLYTLTLKLGRGDSTITWPNSISWKDDVIINSQNNSNTYFIFLFTVDQGTSWKASFLNFT